MIEAMKFSKPSFYRLGHPLENAKEATKHINSVSFS